MNQAPDAQWQHCPRCKSQRVVQGELSGYFAPPFLDTFAQPELNPFAPPGVRLFRPSAGCRDCGLFWSFPDKQSLNAYIDKHCRSPTAGGRLPTLACPVCASANTIFGRMKQRSGSGRGDNLLAGFTPRIKPGLLGFLTFVPTILTGSEQTFACRDCGAIIDLGHKENLKALPES